MWVLVHAKGAANLQALDLGSSKVVKTVPVSPATTSVTQLATGLVATGSATATTGAVQFLNGSSGAEVATIPVSAPVRGLYPGGSGTWLYVLEESSKAADVAVIRTQTKRVTATLPLSLQTVGIAVSPSGHDLFALQPGGTVDDISTRTQKIVGKFPVGGNGMSLCISPSGNQMYVLKKVGSGSDRNVAVVDISTESVKRVIPAPADATAVVPAANEGIIYDAVGTARYGNIQSYHVKG